MNLQPRPSSPIRAAIAVEQTLGHVTHYRNLRDFAGQQTAIEPVWLPIPFDVNGPLRMVPLLRSNWSVRASWRARRAVERVLARTHLDALVFHTQVTSLFSCSLMRRIPSIISLDATPINYDEVGRYYGHRAAGDGFVDRQKYRMNRSSLHAAAHLVTWSEWTKRSLIEQYDVPAERVTILAPGAARGYFDIGQQRGMTASAAAPGKPVRILFVGGDFERKGGPALLEAMRGPLGELCELHVVTQANVPVAHNVHVHRGVHANSPELLRLFAESEIFVLPTMADCLAVVLMEATAAGLPVITTTVGALSEAVRHNESGLLIPPGDARELTEAISALAADPQLRQRMGRAGHALARDKYDAHRNNGALFDLISELASEQPEQRRVA
jgi:glycosyltransferase involved in cell wall biosynthesis